MAILEEGLYSGEITDWTLGESSTGKPVVEFKVKLTGQGEGDSASSLEKPIIRTVSVYLTPASMEMSSATLRAIGYKKKSLKELHREHPEAHDFFGTAVKVDVFHDEYRGRTTEKVQFRRESSRVKKLGLDNLQMMEDLGALFAGEQEKHLTPEPVSTAAGQGESEPAADGPSGKKTKVKK